MSLVPIPTLDQLAAEPARAAQLPPEVARDLLPRVIGLQTALLARALEVPASGNGRAEAPREDRLLTVGEAARKLRISKDQIYRKPFPFTVRLGRQLRFSERGIEGYIRARQGR